ncbi:acyl-CoA dehydrogenase family protein [Peribacillus butanolivorans]
MQKTKGIYGGSFIVEELKSDTCVTPEDITEEQKLFVEMTRDFVINEIIPNEEKLEKLDYELTKTLLRKAGEIGLLGVDVPEQFGGLELDKVSSTFISEALSKTSSFLLSIGTQTGIGSLPIVYFGTLEQRQKYLPDIVTGTKVGAYCLTEPSAGSDALGAKTTAVLSSDSKQYKLNGSKVFITNGGFADIYIVYAKVDGKHFSAFIVERDTPGFTVGPEEKKMGLKASSTCPLYFDNVHIPVENLLGKVGKGHLIAFNILNLGRHKLPTNCLGNAKEALELSATYANARTQFGTTIAKYPLVGKKLAEINILIYVLETMVYRIAGMFDDSMRDIDHSFPDIASQSEKAIAEYAIECSIVKVFGSEVLDFVVDEGVQIHGGYGFIQEYKIERMYRDSRVNRIFEGTNEINRLLIPSTLFKKSAKEASPLAQWMEEFGKEVATFIPQSSFTNTLAKESYLVSIAKKMFLFIGGMAIGKYREELLENEQEIMTNLADMLIQIFAMEGIVGRTEKTISKNGENKVLNAIEMTQVFVHEAFEQIHASALEALTTMESGEDLERQRAILSNLFEHTPINKTARKRSIAERIVQSEKYTV